MANTKNSLLWEISHPELSQKSYLFGTMHVKDQRAFSLIDLAFKKIDSCEALATEFNLAEADLGMPSDILDLPDGKELTDYISEKKYAKLRKNALKYIGFDIDLLKHSLPLILTNALAAQILSKEYNKSLDETLWRFALKKEKITLGIETYQEQINILHKIPMDYQIKSLLDIGKNFTKFKKQNHRVAELYEKQDIVQLFKITKKGTGKMRKLLLYDRNAIMTSRISKIVKEQSTFCAIGAAHLAGKKGVLNLLKKEGFKLKNTN